jgi:hypothetical protein
MLGTGAVCLCALGEVLGVLCGKIIRLKENRKDREAGRKVSQRVFSFPNCTSTEC